MFQVTLAVSYIRVAPPKISPLLMQRLLLAEPCRFSDDNSNLVLFLLFFQPYESLIQRQKQQPLSARASQRRYLRDVLDRSTTSYIRSSPRSTGALAANPPRIPSDLAVATLYFFRVICLRKKFRKHCSRTVHEMFAKQFAKASQSSILANTVHEQFMICFQNSLRKLVSHRLQQTLSMNSL